MKIQNKKLRGGRRPIFQCPCGKDIDCQAAGKKPVAYRTAFCGLDCGYYKSTLGPSK